jgi:serine/threonine protein kinase
MQKLNPKALNKSMFLQSRNLSRETAERYLSEVEAGIKHLHFLGYVHNDLNPSNIMITTDDTAVIIDFDSCVRVGESIEAAKIKRTYGWYDRQSQVAIESIDFAALKEIRTWLTSNCPEGFQYKDT